MKFIPFLVVMPLVTFWAVAAHAGDQVKLKEESNHISVSIDGKPFTDYWFGTRPDRPYVRPFFFPVLATDGTPVTADHYGQKEHPHHQSLMVAHGDFTGADHWALSKGQSPKQRHLKFDQVSGDTIIEELDWEGTDFQPMLHERRTMKFMAFPDQSRGIEFTLEFTPIKAAVTFGDTKEAGLVAVRMNDQIPKNKAVLTNSTGAHGEKATWGKPADWCDISGRIDDKEYGVAVFDSPANPLHPQRWHVREYGLLAANPFGLSYYDRKVPKHAGDFVMQPDKTTVFNYLVIVHTGDAASANLDEKYRHFAQATSDRRGT
jgi:hypothetical protein